MTEQTNYQVYEVEVNGFTTTMRLSDQQAEARGLTVKNQPAAKAAPAKKAAKRAPNKARTAANK